MSSEKMMIRDETAIPKRKRSELSRSSPCESTSPPMKKVQGSGMAWNKFSLLTVTGSNGTRAMLSTCSNTKKKHVSNSDYPQASTTSTAPPTIREVVDEENDRFGENSSAAIISTEETCKKGKQGLPKPLATEILKYFRVNEEKRKVLEEENLVESHLMNYLYHEPKAKVHWSKSFSENLSKHISEMGEWWKKIEASLEEARTNTGLIRTECRSSPIEDNIRPEEDSSDAQSPSSSDPITPGNSTSSHVLISGVRELGFGAASPDKTAQHELSSEERSSSVPVEDKIPPKESSLDAKVAGVSACDTLSVERVLMPSCSNDVDVKVISTSNQVLGEKEAGVSAFETLPGERALTPSRSNHEHDAKVLSTSNQVICLDEDTAQTRTRKVLSTSNQVICLDEDTAQTRKENCIEKQNQKHSLSLHKGTETEPISVDSDDEQTENVPNLPEQTNVDQSSSKPSKHLHNCLLEIPDTCNNQQLSHITCKLVPSSDSEDEHIMNPTSSPIHEDASAEVMPCSEKQSGSSFDNRSEKVLLDGIVEQINHAPSEQTLKEPSSGISSRLNQAQHNEKDTPLDVLSPIQIESTLASVNPEIHVDEGPEAPLEQGPASGLECSQTILPAGALISPCMGVEGCSDQQFNGQIQDPSLDSQSPIQPTSPVIISKNAGSSIDTDGPGSRPSLTDLHLCSTLGTQSILPAGSLISPCMGVEGCSDQQFRGQIQDPSLDSQSPIQPTSPVIISKNAGSSIDTDGPGSRPSLADLHLCSTLGTQSILPAGSLISPCMGVEGCSDQQFHGQIQDPSLDSQSPIQPTSQIIISSNAGSSIDTSGPGSGPSLADLHLCSSLATNGNTNAQLNSALIDTDSNQQLEEPVQDPSLGSQTHVPTSSQPIASSNTGLSIDSTEAGSGSGLVDLGFGSSLRSNDSTYALPDPLLIHLGKLQKEDVEAVKKHRLMVMQIESAKDRALAELNKRHHMLLCNAQLLLTQKRMDLSTSYEKTLANVFLADALRQSNDMAFSETEVAKGNYHALTLQMVELQSLLLAPASPAAAIPMPARPTVSPTNWISNQSAGLASPPYFAQPAQIPVRHRYENSQPQHGNHSYRPSAIYSTPNFSTSSPSPSPGMLLRHQASDSVYSGSQSTRILHQHGW